MQKTITFDDVAIVSDKLNDNRIDFWYMSKDEVINIMKYSELKERKGSLHEIKNLIFRLCIKNEYLL